MSPGMIAAVLLQTGCIIVFIIILTPFRVSGKKLRIVLGLVLSVLTSIICWQAVQSGTIFLARYGFYIISIPLLGSFYLLSRARGVRFFFIAMTSVVLQQMLLTLLMAFRVFVGGFTALYFLVNFLAFGILLAGGWILRREYHRIVFAYQYEFYCITAILVLLFLFSTVFSPITDQNTVDPELFLITLFFDLLIILLYLYIGVSFHSLGQRIDAEKDSLALRFQMEESENNLERLRISQEKFFYYHQNFQQHIVTLREMIGRDDTKALSDYLDKLDMDLDNVPENYCQNEAVNLLLGSYSARKTECGITFVTDTRLPGNLIMGSAELCALLGNALDNAFLSAQSMETGTDKTVQFMARLSDGKLLIQVRSPYDGIIRMENGLPHISTQGYEYRIKSMEAIVEKCGGLSSYQAADGILTVRFVF